MTTERTHAPEGRIALVTGAARGLGRAMSLGLVKAGYTVAAFDLASSSSLLDELASEASGEGLGRLVPIHGDVSDWSACEQAVIKIVAELGPVDILVNNAGFGLEQVTKHIHDGSLKFYALEEPFWTRLMDVNFNGAFRMAKLVAPYQIERGWGRIINVTTSFATMVRRGFSPYGPSKAALEAATAIWAQDLAGTGVTVNALIPGGPVDTRFIPVEDVADRSQLLKPDVMVAPLTWLVSQAADQTTGRRFIAKLWDAQIPADTAAHSAGSPAAWEAVPVWK